MIDGTVSDLVPSRLDLSSLATGLRLAGSSQPPPPGGAGLVLSYIHDPALAQDR